METFLAIVQNIAYVGVGLFIGLLVLTHLKKKVLVKVAKTPSKNDDIVIPYLFKGLRYTLYYFSSMLVLQNFGVKVDIFGWLGGFVGLAVAMNSKPLIAWIGDLLTLTLLKPIKEGKDYHFIKAGVEGTVIDITLSKVLVLNDNKKVVELPFDMALGDIIERKPTEEELALLGD